MNKKTALLVIAITLFSGCVGSAPRPELTPPSISAAIPQITDGEDFECWTAPAREAFPSERSKSEQLLIVYSDVAVTNGSNLYRFDFSTPEYSLLISNIVKYDSERSSPVSPDGRYLWYAVNTGPSNYLIFVYDLANNISREVPFPGQVDAHDDAINWSADSECLVLWHEKTASAYRLADGALQQKAFDESDYFLFDVSPSPDGQWWAWPCRGGVCVMNPAGQQIHHQGLSVPIDKSTGYDYRHELVRWSPDGNVLAFAYASVNPVGVDTLRLVFLDGDRIVSYDDISTFTLDDLRWSSNGHQLLMVDGNGKILKIYDVPSGQVIELSNLQGYSTRVTPVWSPSGNQMAFIGEDDHRLFVMNADGTEVSELPLPPALDTTHSTSIDNIFWVTK